ncbi:pilus assembly protein TadG-related protein [Qipengyuania sp. CAU 1752]
MKSLSPPTTDRPRGFLTRLGRDRAGNTLALMAAGIIPLIAMVGGAVDMSRAYLASSRLQQACDAGVLAARKYLGSSVSVDDKIPAKVSDIGTRFFNINYKDGEYATTGRSFAMFLEKDFAVSGEAAVQVPAVVMQMFGAEDIPIEVTCKAELSIPNVDIMMALDVTGSMRLTNSGDSQTRIESLKQVIRNFHAKVEGSKGAGTRTRYGFVPYASNVNVGHLLRDDWMVTDWSYQSRELDKTNREVKTRTYTANWKHVSGTLTDWQTLSSYPATARTTTTTTGGGSGDNGSNPTTTTTTTYTCDGATPPGTLVTNDTQTGTSTQTVTDPDGTRTVIDYDRLQNGMDYRTTRSGTTCLIERRTYTAYKSTYQKITEPYYSTTLQFNYKPIKRDVSNWRSEVGTCIEERSTYNIGDPDTVDLTKALDLDINLVPDPSRNETKWRPRYEDIIYVRSIRSNGTGSVTKAEVTSTENFVQTGTWWFSVCPPKAAKLAEMNATALNTYLDTLQPFGATYHDIGMIWAARLISPDGLFATENANLGSSNTVRAIIFLTDGQTEPYDIAYGSYGVDALDQRRWKPGDTKSLTEVVEDRYLIACRQARNMNISVFVIAFGTTLNPVMKECAGDGRYFEASDSTQLNAAFTDIADSLGDLRITE